MQLQSGTLLQGGKYKIERVLGQGGFGITYLATQVMLDRKVCIKEFFFKDYCNRTAAGRVISSTDGNRDLVSRFLNKFLKEARTISRLDHPNIIRILDIFEENGTAYYVMEYIDGYSLEDKVNRQGALSENEAIGYIMQVGNALEYIHQNRINHLDVKPANIMIRRNDNKATLIDFGVSKQYDEQGGQTSTTPVGISYGYAPMEQYNPSGVSTFSSQTDIYSLGATLYKLVTGNIPPHAMEIFNMGLSGLPRSLSSNMLSAIQKAMQPRRNDRPQSIKDFLNMLSNTATCQMVSSQNAPSYNPSNTITHKETGHWNLERFKECVVAVLGVDKDEVVENASFTNDLGADSLDAIEIIMHVENQLGISIDDSELENSKIKTVGDAMSFIDKIIHSNSINHNSARVYEEKKLKELIPLKRKIH